MWLCISRQNIERGIEAMTTETKQYSTKWDIPIGVGLIVSLLLGYNWIIDNIAQTNSQLLLGGSFTAFCLFVAVILVRLTGRMKP